MGLVEGDAFGFTMGFMGGGWILLDLPADIEALGSRRSWGVGKAFLSTAPA